MDDRATSHGIEGLIARLHGDGVEAGRREASRVLEEAQSTAREMVTRAQAEAEALKVEARAAVAAEREAARHAFALARRDALLALKEELCVHLAGRLQRLIAGANADSQAFQRLLMAAVGGEENVVDVDVDEVLTGVTADMLAQGVDLGAARGRVRVRLNGQHVVVDVSDAALVELLSAHLMPRFLSRLHASASE